MRPSPPSAPAELACAPSQLSRPGTGCVNRPPTNSLSPWPSSKDCSESTAPLTGGTASSQSTPVHLARYGCVEPDAPLKAPPTYTEPPNVARVEAAEPRPPPAPSASKLDPSQLAMLSADTESTRVKDPVTNRRGPEPRSAPARLLATPPVDGNPARPSAPTLFQVEPSHSASPRLVEFPRLSNVPPATSRGPAGSVTTSSCVTSPPTGAESTGIQLAPLQYATPTTTPVLMPAA